ncbi:MAG: hypothetical protein IIZ67_05200, partial [Bacilli bacterium]|nr:hypothetical protein [Bacilli bacterium]
MKKSLIIIIFIIIIAAAFGLVLYYTSSMGGTTYKKNLVSAANSYGKQVKTLFQNDGLICSNDGTNFKSIVTIPAEHFYVLIGKDESKVLFDKSNKYEGYVRINVADETYSVYLTDGTYTLNSGDNDYSKVTKNDVTSDKFNFDYNNTNYYCKEG